MATQHQGNQKKRILTLVAAVSFLLVICVVVSLITSQWAMHRNASWKHGDPHGHQWLHEELELTAQEMAAIDTFEGEYRRDRDALLLDFNTRVAELRQILVDQDSYLPEVDVAIHRIHEKHGKLQQLSIQHYYDMLSVLPPEKQEKLRQLAVKALSQPE